MVLIALINRGFAMNTACNWPETSDDQTGLSTRSAHELPFPNSAVEPAVIDKLCALMCGAPWYKL